MDSDGQRSHLAAGVDRISTFPKNLARTSVLSKKWKTIWESRSHLVFDEKFFSQLVAARDNTQTQLHTVVRTISNIILLHSGPILKFHLFVPEDLPLHQCQDMDIWIKHVSKNGVEIFELFNKSPVAYKLPSYLFSCLKLTDLQLTNCILHPPLRFRGFRNLISVELLHVKITADLSLGPQLEELVLRRCNGIEHIGCQFKCNNINLTTLEIFQSGAIDCRWFEFSRNVEELALAYDSGISIDEKSINFDKIIGYMPKILSLHITSHFLQFLEPMAANSWKLPTTMEKLKHLFLYAIDFSDLHEIQYILCLIQSSPNLQHLFIWVKESGEDSSMAVEQYLQLPNITDMILDKLETVEIEDMEGSKAELQLIKILLASSPSLKWMKLKCIDTKLSDPRQELKISQGLLHFTRASSAAHIIWN